MDYFPGETLRQRRSRERRLPPDVAVRIGSDIADALDAASGAGVVHRDLKPENILLEGSPTEPRALPADFGIARLVEGGGGHTGPGAVMGTPASLCPEQAGGEELDGRSDLYSLGIICYEMLAGAPPFWLDNASPSCRQHPKAADPITFQQGSAGWSRGGFPSRGKSELHWVDCQVTPGRREATDRATENKPPLGFRLRW